MANKDRNKRSARKARAAERARVEAAQAASAGSPSSSSANNVKKQEKKAEKKPEKRTEKKAEKKKNKKPNIFRRFLNYLGDVRSEMKRVVWPSKSELKSYSVAIIVMLVIFGVLIWLVDSGIVAILVGYTGLRG